MRPRSQIGFGRTGEDHDHGRLDRMCKLRKAGKMRGLFGGNKVRQLFLRDQLHLKEVGVRDQGPRRDTYPAEK